MFHSGNCGWDIKLSGWFSCKLSIISSVSPPLQYKHINRRWTDPKVGVLWNQKLVYCLVHTLDHHPHRWTFLFDLLPNRVSQRHSSSVDVDICRVDVEHFDVGQHDHAEGFVDLPHGDVLLLQASCVQNLQPQEYIFCIKLHNDFSLSLILNLTNHVLFCKFVYLVQIYSEYINIQFTYRNIKGHSIQSFEQISSQMQTVKFDPSHQSIKSNVFLFLKACLK